MSTQSIIETARMKRFKSMLFPVEKFHRRRKPSQLHYSLVYKDTMHRQNSLYEKFKFMLFTVEEFHHKRKSSWLPHLMVYEEAIHP
ncbi:hypothetical protein EVAR_9160_1 [Eumeta japonica]|uniref:Uncharacterized protein n=1 Tax=Eumeta variegata TaxID=151549 RepID=A0A4C1TWQ9_EUMVA|nr:hypothetical protein EVAR_9160_1 [Eumeta japonica]